MKKGELVHPPTICSTCESRSSSHLGNTVELALGAGVQGEESWPSPLPALALGKLAKQCERLVPVVEVYENWQADQLSYYVGPDPGL